MREVNVADLNGRGWAMGDYGGLFRFLRPSAAVGEVAPGDVEALSRFIRSLPSASRRMAFTSSGIFMTSAGMPA